ncbi:hypothetical protein JNW90_32365 [Micromonospora sp. STR1s_5]|nr:hypothetical protein [Micromonospora sp. STR1s_5]
MKRLLVIVMLLLMSTGCGARTTEVGQSTGAAPLRGFGIGVDQAISAQVLTVHLKICGEWGCAERKVPLSIAGPTSAAPCGGQSDGPDAVACGPVHLPGSGPGVGYAAVPELTADPVTVTVTTPSGAPLPISAEVQVQPRLVDGVPQARLQITADGMVTQSR